MQVRAYCSGRTGTPIRVGPRDEGDLVILLREAAEQCLTQANDRSVSASGPRFVIEGTFTHGPLGLMLNLVDVQSFAAAHACVEVRLTRNLEERRRQLRATVPIDQLEDHLPPPDGYVPEIEVLFGLRGPDMSFEKVTELLGLRPTSVTRPRRPFTSEGKATRQQWVFSSGPLRGSDFREPLQQLLALLAPRTPQIVAISNEMRVQPSVDLIALDYSDRVPALELEPEHLELLARLRSRLWLDVL